MKSRIILFVALMTLVGFLAVFSGNDAQANNGQGARPDHYIIKVDPSVLDLPGQSQALAAKYHGRIDHVYGSALHGFAAYIPASQVNALSADSLVVSVVPDMYVNIAKGGPPGGGGGTNDPQTIPTGITRINGHTNSTLAGNGSGSVDVDVAVVDSGVSSHPDLNIAGGYNCSKGPSSNFSDGNGHGTHVAGTIGAIDNDLGVVGVAPGARIWGVRVLGNSGSGSWADVICGIDWVAANADVIEVANMSLGGTGSDTGCNDGGMNEAICNAVNAGVTFVVAAGNETDDAANHVPAAYDEAITVSALSDFDGVAGGNGSPTCRTDEDDTLANFSNYGADVDIIAPGVCILSTWNDGGYNTISGTSMASPHVAGAAALYKANNPGASPAQVQSALQNAGNLNWDNSDDHDNTKERLLDVGSW